MIEFTTDSCEGACVVHISGSFEPSDDPVHLVEHVVEQVGDQPLIVDLSRLEPLTGTKVTILLRALARAISHATTVLIHPDLDARRSLRARAHGLPVVPSNDLVLHGRFASALVANRDDPVA